jgi:hypothetical protein
MVLLLQLAKHVGALLLVWRSCGGVAASGVRQQAALLGAAVAQILWRVISET